MRGLASFNVRGFESGCGRCLMVGGFYLKMTAMQSLAEKESFVFAVVCVCVCVQASGCACVSGKFVFEDLVWCACENLRSQKE